jgi:transcriptional regulator with XRE-family HTH domain
MSVYLQKQLSERIEANNFSVNALEKKAGLKRSAVRNILQGFSKKPSAAVLLSIAEALDCTVDDLLGSKSSNDIAPSNIKSTSKPHNLHPWNDALYIEAVKLVSKILREKDSQLKSEQTIALINESYKYSLDKGSDEVDVDFTRWLVGRSRY